MALEWGTDSALAAGLVVAFLVVAIGMFLSKRSPPR